MLGFNGRHPRAEQWVRQHSSQLITEIVEDQRQMVRTVILAGVEAGRGARDVARDIVGTMNKVTGRREGGFIGLTSQQADYVIRARAELLSGDPARMRHYLTRQRRDARFDAAVKKAIAAGKPLGVKEVDRITGRYKDRLLKYRGETIARTEGITALGEGQMEGYRQLVESGRVRAEQIVRTWQATPDKATRHSHRAMNGERRTGLDDPFQAPGGSMMRFPRDRSMGASAAETINCRCWMQVRIKRT